MKPTEDELRAAVREALELPDYQRITNPPVRTGYLVGVVRRNGLILGVLLLGIVYIFRQVIVLRPEIDWLENLAQGSQGGLVFPGTLTEKRPPRLLGPMANLLGERRGRITL